MSGEKTLLNVNTGLLDRLAVLVPDEDDGETTSAEGRCGNLSNLTEVLLNIDKSHRIS